MPDAQYFRERRKKYLTRGQKLPHPAHWKGTRRANAIKLELPETPLEEINWNKKFKMADGRMKRLTDKQVLYAKYMLQGYTNRQARIKAGYSVKYAVNHLAKQDKAVMAFFDSMRIKLAKQGIDEDFVAAKMKEWFDAEKAVVTKDGIIDRPDYDVQIKAYDRYKDIIVPKDVNLQGSKKREVRLTEWINEPTHEEGE